MKIERKTEKRVSHKETVMSFDGNDIIAGLSRVSPEFKEIQTHKNIKRIEVYFKVPGGGDWSGDVDIDAECPVYVKIVEEEINKSESIDNLPQH